MGNDVVTLDANTDVCYVVRCISGIVGGVRSVKQQQQQPTSLSRQPYVSRNEQELRGFSGCPHGWAQNSQHLFFGKYSEGKADAAQTGSGTSLGQMETVVL